MPTINNLGPRAPSKRKETTDSEPADHRPEGEWFTEANGWVSKFLIGELGPEGFDAELLCANQRNQQSRA